QSSRLAEFGGRGMSFNICPARLVAWQCSRTKRMARHASHQHATSSSPGVNRTGRRVRRDVNIARIAAQLQLERKMRGPAALYGMKLSTENGTAGCLSDSRRAPRCPVGGYPPR